jgi:OOP family OmpA-OmpF porin
MDAHNLINIAQNFESPELINKFSRALGESVENTRKGLKSVVPTLILGMVSRSKTDTGPDALLNLVNRDGIDAAGIEDFNDENIISIGSDAVDGIFGNNLDNVALNLEKNVGIKSANIKKMMGMAAPLVMGFIASKVRRENLSSSALAGYLSGQNQTLTTLVPDGVVGDIAGVTNSEHVKLNAAEMPYKNDADYLESSPWFVLLMIGILVLSIIWWYTGSSFNT